MLIFHSNWLSNLDLTQIQRLKPVKIFKDFCSKGEQKTDIERQNRSALIERNQPSFYFQNLAISKSCDISRILESEEKEKTQTLKTLKAEDFWQVLFRTPNF